jgi:mRNA interferase MazF
MGQQAAAALSLDQAVDVREEAGRIVIEPIREETFDIDDLVAGITDENRHDPVDTGPSIGRSFGEATRFRAGCLRLVWLEFDLLAGHEPAVVLSPTGYNGKTGLMVCCPLTTRVKGYPFEVALAGQVKNLDWRPRRATRKGKVSEVELRRVRAKLRALIG